MVSFSPMYHWTEQKIRVHTFYCVLALTTAHLMRRHAHQHDLRVGARTARRPGRNPGDRAALPLRRPRPPQARSHPHRPRPPPSGVWPDTVHHPPIHTHPLEPTNAAIQSYTEHHPKVPTPAPARSRLADTL